MARLAWIGVLVLLAMLVARWLFPTPGTRSGAPTGSSRIADRSRKALPDSSAQPQRLDRSHGHGSGQGNGDGPSAPAKNSANDEVGRL